MANVAVQATSRKSRFGVISRGRKRFVLFSLREGIKPISVIDLLRLRILFWRVAKAILVSA